MNWTTISFIYVAAIFILAGVGNLLTEKNRGDALIALILNGLALWAVVVHWKW